MAALFGHMDYWNVSGDILAKEIKNGMREEPVGQAAFFSICYFLLSVPTVLGNALVIAAVWKDPLKTLRSSPTNFILLSLAIADLLAGVVFGPGAALFYLRLALKAYPWTPLMTVLVFNHYFLLVSVFHVLILTIDRYFALAKPLKYRAVVTKGRVRIASSSIWVSCFGVAVLSSIVQRNFFVLWFVYFLIIWIASESFSCLYLLILKKLYRHHHTRIMQENSQSNLVLLCQREKKVSMLILSVVLVFYLCCLPWQINQVLLFFCRVCHEHYRAWMVFYHVATLLLFLNSALNPLLYSWRFSKFRATFRYFLTNVCSQRRHRQRRTICITEERRSYDTKL